MTPNLPESILGYDRRLIGEGYNLEEVKTVGIYSPEQIYYYSHHTRPNCRFEISERGHWSYRTPESAAGTGVRPVGGTSEKTFQYFLRGLTSK